MFVAGTINVLDFQENRVEASSEGAQVEKTLLFAEASARLDFGLEVLRQAGSTPSAARCAGIISRLLKKTGEDGKSPHKPPDGPSPSEAHARSNCCPPSSQIGEVLHHSTLQPINSQYTQGVSAFDSALDPSGQTPNIRSQGFSPGLSFEQQRNQSSLSIDQSQVSPIAAFGDYQIRQSDTGAQQRGNPDFMRDPSGPGMIETPLRWLPENMQDDGSWMLMIDNDPNFMFMADYQP